MSSIFIVGATGLVGSAVLRAAETSKFFSNVTTLTRRDFDVSNTEKVHKIVESDSSKWAAVVKSAPQKDVFYSSLATTRAKAGGLDKQYAIDHDLNLELAKAAKEAGFKTYVIISSVGASAGSRFPYMKMKGELDDAVAKLGFQRTVIVRPGALLGQRKDAHGWGNDTVMFVSGFLHKTPLRAITKSVYDSDIASALENYLSTAPEPTTPEVVIMDTKMLDEYAKKS